MIFLPGRNAVFRSIALISHLFEASNADIGLILIQEQHGESVGKSFGTLNPPAKILAFVMLCLSFTFRLNSHLTELQASCFFQFSSSFNLSVIA